MQITGGETQLDRRVLDMLRDPLVHMIRNSMDHGLETPEERVERKKTPDGLIVFEAFQQSGQVILTMSDDGRGIDPMRVKKKALEKGLITEAQVATMRDREAIKLIFLPGFSTAEKVTALSGRGVGMDAVKSAVESMGGTVDVESDFGRGTKVTLTLPLTLAIVKSLAFHVGKQMYAIPQTNVEEVITEAMARSSGQLATLQDSGRVLHLRKSVIPVVSLRKLLNTDSSGPAIFVVVRYRGERFVLEVDRIAGPRDFVSQPLPRIYEPIDIISGVNQMNSGEYIALIDLAAVGSLVAQTGAVASDGKSGVGSANSDDPAQAISEIFRSQQKLVFFKSGKHFAVPVQAIRQVVQVSASALDSVGDRPYLLFNGKTYPVLRFSTLFGNGKLEERDEYTVLLVQRENCQAAIVCEDFLGIHRLPSEFEMLIRTEGIQGSVTLEGRAFLVANVSTIFAMEFPEEFKSKTSSGTAFHVLVVEDDPFFATALGDYLRAEGFTVSVAGDGLAGKELLEQSLVEGAAPINYVITDFEMPRMNGMELLRWIRHRAEFASMPVTMCTAVGDESTRREAQKLGVDHFSGKMKYEDILPHLIRRRKGEDIGVSAEMSHVTQVISNDVEDGQRRVLTFQVGGHVYGIEIANLKEISTAAVPTLVPGVHACVSHMVGFRGHPIPVLDLRALSRRVQGPSASGQNAEQVVARFGDQFCALWVDHVLNVRRLKSMDRSNGILKKERQGQVFALVGTVLWDDEGPVSLLDGTRITSFLEYIRGQMTRLSDREAKKSA